MYLSFPGILQRVGGDCDIYINNGTYPTRSRWYQRDLSTKSNVTIITPDAAHGNWYIGLYGFEACTFTLEVKVDSTDLIFLSKTDTSRLSLIPFSLYQERAQEIARDTASARTVNARASRATSGRTVLTVRHFCEELLWFKLPADLCSPQCDLRLYQSIPTVRLQPFKLDVSSNAVCLLMVICFILLLCL